jgi:hypothetical protein
LNCGIGSGYSHATRGALADQPTRAINRHGLADAVALSGRNGGFSSCDPQRLYLPSATDPIYGYQSLNVEAQQRTPPSLLHWTRRMIEIRKRHPVFGLGAYEELASSNPSAPCAAPSMPLTATTSGESLFHELVREEQRRTLQVVRSSDH